jgi:hypothetical protein
MSVGARSRGRRAAEFTAYLIIAIAVFAAIGALAVHDARVGRTSLLPIKWIALTCSGAIVFGFTIRDNRRLWKSQRFWNTLVLLLVSHAAVGVFGLTKIAGVPLILFVPAIVVEYWTFGMLVDRLFGAD